jgi:hypothetical protein
MTTDTQAVQAPQSDTHAASDDLELKSVGKGKFVATYHRNAYGQAPRKEA